MTRSQIDGIWYSMDDPRHMIHIQDHWTKPRNNGGGSLIKDYMTDEQIQTLEKNRAEYRRKYGKAYRQKMKELEAKINEI